MYILNENTRKNIENKTGIPFEDIENMDFEDIDFNIEKKIGKKLTYSANIDNGLIGRGSVYIFLNRFLNLKNDAI